MLRRNRPWKRIARGRIPRIRSLAGLAAVGAILTWSALSVVSAFGTTDHTRSASSAAYEYMYDTGRLTVVKHVVKDNGGTAAASDFTMTITGVSATGGNSFPGDEAGTTKEVTPGSYSVTETGPAGYAATFSAGCSGTIAAGESKTCTVTNDDRPAGLTVVKHVINNDNGHAAASGFTMTINGVTATGGNSFPGSESGTTKQVTPGSYSVTETGPAGYVATFSAGCSGTIALGDSKSCTVTNNDIGPARTPGYWKNHPEAITLGLKLGNYTVASTADALAVFADMACNDAASCLAAHLLAAKLNLANGNSSCINPKVAQADALLVSIGYSGPAGTYSLTPAQRNTALALKDALDRYNNGKGC